MDAINLWIGLLTYIATGRLVMRGLNGAIREASLAILNLAGLCVFLFNGGNKRYLHYLIIYVTLITILYFTVLLFANKRGPWPWLAFFAPIAALIGFRYVPAEVYVALGHAIGKTLGGLPALVGMSYLAFRCSRLVLEVRNGAVQKPNFLEYINFAFFLPTMPVGPINTYANFRRGFVEPLEIPIGRAGMRFLVGAVKYQFLGNLCNQLTYSALLIDDHPHPWMDLPVAMVFYYLFLYLNFSGLCDVAIGAAALMGIAVPENFENPLMARNMRDFWNRWHITLSMWMRDLVFTPLSKILVRIMGVKQADHAIALTILVTFLLIGVWHGVGMNYVAFGLAQAIGVVTVHYYTIFLKNRFGREEFKAYNENRRIRAVGVAITFCYFSATLFLFANTFAEMRQILSVLR